MRSGGRNRLAEFVQLLREVQHQHNPRDKPYDAGRPPDLLGQRQRAARDDRSVETPRFFDWSRPWLGHEGCQTLEQGLGVEPQLNGVRPQESSHKGIWRQAVESLFLKRGEVAGANPGSGGCLSERQAAAGSGGTQRGSKPV